MTNRSVDLTTPTPFVLSASKDFTCYWVAAQPHGAGQFCDRLITHKLGRSPL